LNKKALNKESEPFCIIKCRLRCNTPKSGYYIILKEGKRLWIFRCPQDDPEGCMGWFLTGKFYIENHFVEHPQYGIIAFIWGV